MDENFWHQKWANREIGFHQSQAHPLLVKYLPALNLAKEARIFLPLCGKTLDIHWLLAQGYQVAGAELSQIAVDELFSELDIRPSITALGKISRYSAPNLDIFVGDIFTLNAEQLGEVNAIYDRAALVALPETMRERYTKHLIELSQSAPQLLISFDYNQTLMEGPPFAVPAAEVTRLYQAGYQFKLLEVQQLERQFRACIDASEFIGLLGTNY